jgi:hypothetical protein
MSCADCISFVDVTHFSSRITSCQSLIVVCRSGREGVRRDNGWRPNTLGLATGIELKNGELKNGTGAIFIDGKKGCQNLVPHQLPPGAVLTVVAPDGTYIFTSLRAE